MNVYLAAVSTMEQYFRDGELRAEGVSVLASFYGISDFEKEYAKKFKSIIIDSGAFTFMRGTARANWDSRRILLIWFAQWIYFISSAI